MRGRTTGAEEQTQHLEARTRLERQTHRALKQNFGVARWPSLAVIRGSRSRLAHTDSILPRPPKISEEFKRVRRKAKEKMWLLTPDLTACPSLLFFSVVSDFRFLTRRKVRTGNISQDTQVKKKKSPYIKGFHSKHFSTL